MWTCPNHIPDSRLTGSRTSARIKNRDELEGRLGQRIMVIDGAMGTAIQRDRPDEAGYRGERFGRIGRTAFIGNNDLLTLTQPHIIAEGIHREYREVGAHPETNTFTHAISLADYAWNDLRLRTELRRGRPEGQPDESHSGAGPHRRGRIRPDDNRTASISPGRQRSWPATSHPTTSWWRRTSRPPTAWSTAVPTFSSVETIFDSLNAKAAVFAVETLFEEWGRRWPVIISGTITDASGRTPSGQTTEAFWNCDRHAKPIAVGLNCALGAREMRLTSPRCPGSPIPACRAIQMPVCPTPSASTTSPRSVRPVIASSPTPPGQPGGRLLGRRRRTSAEIAKVVEGKKRPRDSGDRGRHPARPRSRSNITDGSLFVNIGERTNITGSARFRNLIKAEDYDTALSVACSRSRNGAQVIDINMDEGMIDGVARWTGSPS